MWRVREGTSGCRIKTVYYLGQCKLVDHAGKKSTKTAGICGSEKTLRETERERERERERQINRERERELNFF